MVKNVSYGAVIPSLRLICHWKICINISKEVSVKTKDLADIHFTRSKKFPWVYIQAKYVSMQEKTELFWI